MSGGRLSGDALKDKAVAVLLQLSDIAKDSEQIELAIRLKEIASEIYEMDVGE